MKTTQRLIAFLLLVGIIMCFTACNGSSQAVFDKTIALIEQYYADENSVENEDIYENMRKLGLTSLDAECAIDRAFLEDYLKEHTLDEFLQKFFLLNNYMMLHTHNYTKECTLKDDPISMCPRHKCMNILKTALDISGCPLTTIKIPAEGTPGYYSENADRYPAHYEETISRGYNYGAYNEIAFDHKPHYEDISYHGDYAVYHSYGYKVNKGNLGWENGVFVDVPSSWEYEDYYYVTYRDVEITDHYTTLYSSAEAAIAAAEQTEIFSYGDKIYRITPEQTCGNSGHTYQSWTVFIDPEALAIAEQEENERNAQLERKYDDAKALLEAGKYTEAISAFEALDDYKDSTDQVLNSKYAYAVSLRQAGNVFEAYSVLMDIPNHPEAIEVISEIVHDLNIKTIEAGIVHTIGLKEDGTVVAVGADHNGRCNVADWADIVAVAAGGYHSVGLKADGTVLAVGNNDCGQCEVSGWTDIVAISAGSHHTIGLKGDGTVVAVGENYSNQTDVGGWNNIIAISTGTQHSVGLRSDGTVVATGLNDDNQCEVSTWTNIISVSAGNCHTVGLRSDGRVVAVGDNFAGRCDVNSWTNIIAISADEYQTVGLKADGSVVATGNNEYGRCNVSTWKDIVAISAGYSHTIGLRSDGTVVATEFTDKLNYSGQCDVSGWTNIKRPNKKSG